MKVLTLSLLVLATTALATNPSPLPLNADCAPTGSVCADALVCAGPSGGHQKCVRAMKAGKQCDIDPYWVCAPGLDCVDNVCIVPTIPLGGSCASSGSVCADKLECAGPTDARVCVKPVSVGGRCEHEPFWVCKEGLVCEGNVCKLPEEGRCNDSGSVCVDGTVCAGTNFKKCVVPMEEGGSCGGDPFWVCTYGLDCTNGKCQKPRVPLGGSCESSESVCEENLRCAGPDDARVCVMTAPVGERCEHEPFWVCAEGIICEGNVCKIPEEGQCNDPGSVCVDGTVCAGTKFKKCVVPMEEGGSCGGDPFWVCADGLDCTNGKCQKPRVPLGGSCESSESVCEESLRCAGPDDARVCVMTTPVGERCEHEPFWVCAEGIICEGNVCKIPEEGQCNDPGSVCVDGTVCAGTKFKKCVVPMEEGGSCGGDPFWVCADGLNCEDGKCQKPKVPLGGSCVASGSVCEENLTCVGPSDERVCAQTVPAGARCEEEPFVVCEEELTCEKNVCKVPKDGLCNNRKTNCVEGTVCVGTSSMKCVVPLSEGESCGNIAFDICAEGFVCDNGKCQKPRIPLGGSCAASGSVCVHGLSCVGSADAKVCVTTVPVGGSCEDKPFFICESGLTCEKNICKVPRLGDCTPAGSICIAGTKCVGPSDRKKCNKPMPVGEKCNTDPYMVCDKGLACVSNMCRIIVPLNGNCSLFGTLCKSGLVCVGTGKRKKCAVGKKLGQYCKPPIRVCKSGLRCDKARCRTSVKAGGDCGSVKTSCASGLVCAGPHSDRRCVTTMKVGDECQTDPYWVCGSGMSCENNICTKH